jgi:hypothetical protein
MKLFYVKGSDECLTPIAPIRADWFEKEQKRNTGVLHFVQDDDGLEMRG